MTRPRRYGFLKLFLNNQSGKLSRFFCCEAIVDGLFVVEKALDNIWEGCCFIGMCNCRKHKKGGAQFSRAYVPHAGETKPAQRRVSVSVAVLL